MSELRWILAGIGLIVLLVMFFWGRAASSHRRKQRMTMGRNCRLYSEPYFEDDVIVKTKEPVSEKKEDGSDWEDPHALRSEPVLGEAEIDISENEPVLHDIAEHQPEETEQSDLSPQIVVMHIAASEGELMTGKEIVAAARQAGLLYGKMKIFHKVVDNAGKKESLFGIANMLEPGVFEPSQFDKLRTPGLTLFLQLPTALPAVDAFDSMLETADQLAKKLNGVLLDDARQLMGQEWIDDVRYRLIGQ
jgi:cell division protein ZipA